MRRDKQQGHQIYNDIILKRINSSIYQAVWFFGSYIIMSPRDPTRVQPDGANSEFPNDPTPILNQHKF